MTATLPRSEHHAALPAADDDDRADGTLRALLAPRSIAVIGASRRAGTMGHQILSNLITYGFTGAVYPVNPRASAICSVRAWPRVDAIPDRVDLAIVVVPQAQVMDVVAESCAAGVKGLIVISAGYREMGEAGAERERALADFVRQQGVRMVGPNCMGIVNADPAVSMNATFATAMPPFGHAAFVSQSGALGLNVLDHAREYGIGISQFVSVGNKPDVSGNDLLLEWEHDPAVRVVLMYVESFGNPQRFLRIASRITRHKPIIAVKSGRSRAGARAASSHTGALAASDIAVDAMLHQAGVLRASSIEELFDMAMAFGARALPRSRRAAVLTNAGGPGILAADAMEACGVELADLSPATVAALRPLFPAEASIRNPLDMIASATAAGYTTAMTALLADPGVDTVVPIFVPPFGVRQEDVAEAIVTAARSDTTKPVLAVLMGREGLAAGREDLRRVGIPTYIFPESAARALAALNRHVEWTERALPVPEHFPVDRPAARSIIRGAQREQREALTELESLDLLRAYGLHVADARLVTDADQIPGVADALGYPLVMKIVSPDITHKTDVGGVVVGLTSEADVRDAHATMRARVRDRAPAARVTGVLLQRMVQGGRETIVGMSRDANFGPLVMFGLGGVLVEALRDVVFRMAPVGRTDAREMMRGIRGAQVLDGVRGEPPVNARAVEDAICLVAQLAVDFPEIVELDVNPLLASARGALALDARVRIALSPA
jgi:acetyltransferase